MPRKFSRKRKYRRKPRRRRSGFNTNVLSHYQPFARKKLWKTRYTDRITLNPGVAGTVATHIFSANGLFDPDITGVGHQPNAFDQLVGTLYDHAVVIGAQITIMAANTDATNSQFVGCMLADATTLITDPNIVMENGNVKFKQMTALGSGGNKTQITAKINPNKFLGHSMPLSDDVLKNDVASNPAEQAYFHVVAWPTQGNNTDVVECMIIIDYVCVLLEPKKLGLS